MLRLIALLLPALFPSWRFFKTVAPSPRIEYRLIRSGQPDRWQADRPRPGWLSFRTMLMRMLWNPHWNEQLYLVSLSERVIGEESAHSIREINRLVSKCLSKAGQGALVQFRLVFLSRDGPRILRTVLYESDPVAVAEVR